MHTALPKTDDEIFYPETDGQPMANNTKQAQAMMILKENLDILFENQPDVFIAIGLFWYPVKGRPDIVQAPDVMVVLGRPKGHRGSYKQWEEGGIAPQVVFEVLSPANTPAEMEAKYRFYERYGVQEYYVYDPESGEWRGWVRRGGSFVGVDAMEGWESPLLGVRFGRGVGGEDVGVYDRGGERFRYVVELRRGLLEAVERARAEAERERQQAEMERLRAERAQQEAQVERQRAERERQQAEAERQRAEQLAQKLRELGIDPDKL